MAAIDVDDLLSDDSNDSFFEDPKLISKRNSFTKTTEKKDIGNIFGVSEEKPETKKTGDDWLGLNDGDKNSKEPLKKVGFEDDVFEVRKTIVDSGKETYKQSKAEIKKSSLEEDEDILSSLGFSKKPIPETQKNPKTTKSSLFDDILGSSPKRERKNLDFTDILMENKPSKVEKKELNPPPTRESRRSRSSTSTLADPLGLFSKETQKQPNEAGDAGKRVAEAIPPTKTAPALTKSAPNITELPDWLSGSSPSVKQHKSDPELCRVVSVSADEKFEPELETLDTSALIAQQKLATANASLQNTAIAMQQQESQLVVALQLKKYEEKLLEMQKYQQQILLKQDQQFNDLLQKQFLKQQVLEENMRQQQQRIQNHIELLLQQPLSLGTCGDHFERTEELKKSKENETVKLYEDIISTLKQRQHEEMFLLEESYKKQINLLEQSMLSLETRLKTELETAVEIYHDKLKQTDDNYKEEIRKHKQKLEEISQQQANEIKMIRESHLRVVEEIKNEYNLLTENLKLTKATENELLTNADEYTQKLDRSLSVLDTNSKALLNIQNVIEKNCGTFYATREESIKAKEEEIRLMRNALEKAREAAETERAQLMGLVRTLEMKIVEQNQNSREERWALQQATATLTAKAAALDREADFSRALLEREREQIKTLKESILAEQEKNMLSLTEQRLILEAEKSRIETAAKLHKNYDPQVARAEIDAAVQVAKEAAELTDKEREKLQRQQYELESIKRNLLDKERKLTLKERELDSLMQKAESKIRDGERAMDTAKMLEIKYNERMKDLQNQMASLTSRERKLAEEKIELSKERLALHTLVRQNRKCGLCAVDSNSKNEQENTVEPDLHNFSMIESNINRLRLEINESREDLLQEFSNKD